MTSIIFRSEQMSFEDISLGFERFQGYMTTLSRLEEIQPSDEYDDDVSSFPGEIVEMVGEESLNLGEKLKNMIKSLVAFFKKIVASIKDRLKKFVHRKKANRIIFMKDSERFEKLNKIFDEMAAEKLKVLEPIAEEIYTKVKFPEIPTQIGLMNFEKEIELTNRIVTDNGKLVGFFEKFIGELFSSAVMKEEIPIPEFDMAKLINISAANSALKSSGRELIVSEHSVKIGKTEHGSLMLKEASFKDAGWPNPFKENVVKKFAESDTRTLHVEYYDKIGNVIDKTSNLLDRLPNQIDSGAVTREVANKICNKAHQVVQALSSVTAMSAVLYLAHDGVVRMLAARLRKANILFNEKTKSE